MTPSDLDKDLGFGSVVARESRRRLLNPDGSFNVARDGLGPLERLAPYHSLIAMRWPRFLTVLTGFYLLVNLAFAVAFWLCGPDAIVDSAGTVPDGRFARAFFFSVETLATIGYGSLAPAGLVSNLLMTAESLVGLLAAALITGLVFARFARPTARIRFSRAAVVAPYGDGSAFMFRIVNERRNEVVQLEARVLYSRMVERNGRRVRVFDDVALERERVVFFPLAWTIVHPIGAASPLRDATREALEASDAEFLILLSGFDETFSQTVHARRSYKPHEVRWGARFASVFNAPHDDGTVSIDIRRLDATEQVG